MNIEKILISITGLGLLGIGIVTAMGKTEELKSAVGSLGIDLSFLSDAYRGLQTQQIGKTIISLISNATSGTGTVTNVPTGETIVSAVGGYPVLSSGIISPVYLGETQQNVIDILNTQVQSVRDIVASASASKYTLFQSMGGAYRYWSSVLMGK